jgi:hypothetical protein
MQNVASTIGASRSVRLPRYARTLRHGPPAPDFITDQKHERDGEGQGRSINDQSLNDVFRCEIGIEQSTISPLKRRPAGNMTGKAENLRSENALLLPGMDLILAAGERRTPIRPASSPQGYCKLPECKLRCRQRLVVSYSNGVLRIAVQGYPLIATRIHPVGLTNGSRYRLSGNGPAPHQSAEAMRPIQNVIVLENTTRQPLLTPHRE